jgi:hypothetical protein
MGPAIKGFLNFIDSGAIFVKRPDFIEEFPHSPLKIQLLRQCPGQFE